VNLSPDSYHVVDTVVNGSLLKVSNVLYIGLAVLILYYVILRFHQHRPQHFLHRQQHQDVLDVGYQHRENSHIAFMLSGLGAALVASRCLPSATAATGGRTAYVLNSIAAVVVGGTALTGGTGGVINTIFGSVFMSMLDNGMNVVGIDQYLQQAILGVMVIIGVTLTFDRERTPIVK